MEIYIIIGALLICLGVGIGSLVTFIAMDNSRSREQELKDKLEEIQELDRKVFQPRR